MRTRMLAAAAALLLLASAGCAARAPKKKELTGLDPKLSTFAYMEEGNLVSFIVGTRAAMYRKESAFIPLEVCIANRGVKTLSLTRESFTLVDDAGKRYPAAGPRELMEGYEYLDIDRRLNELSDIVFNRFATFTQYPSKFSPTRQATVRGDSNLVRDQIELPKFGYIIDTLYFPKPDGEIADRKFELFLSSNELPDPVFVKFQIR